MDKEEIRSLFYPLFFTWTPPFLITTRTATISWPWLLLGFFGPRCGGILSLSSYLRPLPRLSSRLVSSHSSDYEMILRPNYKRSEKRDTTQESYQCQQSFSIYFYISGNHIMSSFSLFDLSDYDLIQNRIYILLTYSAVLSKFSLNFYY
jgi:hypothetical protein